MNANKLLKNFKLLAHIEKTFLTKSYKEGQIESHPPVSEYSVTSIPQS